MVRTAAALLSATALVASAGPASWAQNLPQKIQKQLQRKLQQQQVAARGLQEKNTFDVAGICEGDCMPKLLASSMTLFDEIVACQPVFETAATKTADKLKSAFPDVEISGSVSAEVSAEVSGSGGNRRLAEEWIQQLNASLVETVQRVRRMEATDGMFGLFDSECPLDVCAKPLLTEKCADKDDDNKLTLSLKGDMSAMVLASMSRRLGSEARRLGLTDIAAGLIEAALEDTGIMDAMLCFFKPFLNFACTMCADDKCTKDTVLEQFMCPKEDKSTWSAVADVDVSAGAGAFAEWGGDKEGFSAGANAAASVDASLSVTNPFAEVIEQPNMDEATALMEELCLYNKVGKFYCLEPKKLSSVFTAMPSEVPDPCAFDCNSVAGKVIKSMGCCMGSFLDVADEFGAFDIKKRKAAKMIIKKCGTLAICKQVGKTGDRLAKAKKRFIMAKKSVKKCPVTFEDEMEFKKSSGKTWNLEMKYWAKITVTGCKEEKCASGSGRLLTEESPQVDVVVPVSGSDSTVDKESKKISDAMQSDSSTGQVSTADAQKDDDVEQDLVTEMAPDGDEATTSTNATSLSGAAALAPALLATLAACAAAI